MIMLPMLSGCGRAIIGQWRAVEAIPNREVFYVDSAVFRADGTYDAMTTIEGLTQDESGTYSFNGWELKLRPDEGGQHKFLANVRLKRLEIANGEHKVILRKQ